MWGIHLIPAICGIPPVPKTHGALMKTPNESRPRKRRIYFCWKCHSEKLCASKKSRAFCTWRVGAKWYAVYGWERWKKASFALVNRRTVSSILNIRLCWSEEKCCGKSATRLQPKSPTPRPSYWMDEWRPECHFNFLLNYFLSLFNQTTNSNYSVCGPRREISEGKWHNGLSFFFSFTSLVRPATLLVRCWLKFL